MAEGAGEELGDGLGVAKAYLQAALSRHSASRDVIELLQQRWTEATSASIVGDFAPAGGGDDAARSSFAPTSRTVSSELVAAREYGGDPEREVPEDYADRPVVGDEAEAPPYGRDRPVACAASPEGHR